MMNLNSNQVVGGEAIAVIKKTGGEAILVRS